MGHPSQSDDYPKNQEEDDSEPSSATAPPPKPAKEVPVPQLQAQSRANMKQSQEASSVPTISPTTSQLGAQLQSPSSLAVPVASATPQIPDYGVAQLFLTRTPQPYVSAGDASAVLRTPQHYSLPIHGLTGYDTRQGEHWYDAHGTLYVMPDRGHPAPAAISSPQAPPAAIYRDPVQQEQNAGQASSPRVSGGVLQPYSAVPTMLDPGMLESAPLSSPTAAPTHARSYPGVPSLPQLQPGLSTWSPSYTYSYYPYVSAPSYCDPAGTMRPYGAVDSMPSVAHGASQAENYEFPRDPSSSGSIYSSIEETKGDSSHKRRQSIASGTGELKTDAEGVPWLKFEYSCDRVQCSYHIRCDIDNVDENAFAAAFREENCVYPKAMVPPGEYKGHRQHYESVCNQIGWRLAFRNPVLQSRRGLIQRAVDTYRNSSQDISTRSRRARRLVKQQEQERRRQSQHPRRR